MVLTLCHLKSCPTVMQRISAGDFDMKLRHFGQSVSAFSDQEDNQRQKYISVGSQGTVTVLE